MVTLEGSNWLVPALVCLGLGYVLGSVPSGLWLVKLFHHLDIRDYGSKNIGATNVYRTVGPVTAALVFLCDTGKGILACYLAQRLYASDWLTVAAAVGTLLGHNCSLFLKFKGGKGVATGLGILVFLMPDISCVSLGIWLVTVYCTKYVSLGSILATGIVPFLAWYWDYPLLYVILGVAGGVFIIMRHKDNVLRLLRGNENKIKADKAEDLH